MKLKLGHHLICEAVDCNSKILDNEVELTNIMLKSCIDGGAGVLGHVTHKFTPQGVTVVVGLSESHASLHSWPENNFLSFDVYTCGDHVDTYKILDSVMKNIESKEYIVKYISRGIPNMDKLYCDETFFDKIDTEEKAYWLGFLYADGYVTIREGHNYILGLCLSENDSEHLMKFRKAIQSEHHIKHYSHVARGKEYKDIRLQITNKNVVMGAVSKGIVPKKSMVLTFPTLDIIKPELYNHFIRGYFDGDGCVTYSNGRKIKKQYQKVQILGTLEFLNKVKEIINIGNAKIIKSRNVYILQYNSEFSKEFAKYIYKNSNIYLERKKNKFNEHNEIIFTNYSKLPHSKEHKEKVGNHFKNKKWICDRDNNINKRINPNEILNYPGFIFGKIHKHIELIGG